MVKIENVSLSMSGLSLLLLANEMDNLKKREVKLRNQIRNLHIELMSNRSEQERILKDIESIKSSINKVDIYSKF